MKQTGHDLRAIAKLTPALRWVPVVVAGGCFLGWMWAFNYVAELLAIEGDKLEMLARFGSAVVVVGTATGLSAAFIIRRAMRRYPPGPLCRHCGQSLRGVPAGEGVIRCPECGKDSPVADR